MCRTYVEKMHKAETEPKVKSKPLNNPVKDNDIMSGHQNLWMKLTH